MATAIDVLLYNKELDAKSKVIAKTLFELINKTLPKADGKVWHGHPVWFLDENPVVGYSLKKSGVELLFWSGQSFDEPLLNPVGKYKAAGIIFTEISEVKKTLITRFLRQAKTIQWDYKNLPKNKKLIKLT
jgi:hypothetical protein